MEPAKPLFALVINSGNNDKQFFHLLLGNIGHFFGLASLRFRATNICWILLSVATKKGSAPVSNLAFSNKWLLDISSLSRGEIQPRSDEKRILSNVAVLEGAAAIGTLATVQQ